ncbi:MAG: VOC family protein [Streptosporangiales bacterium]|nr:VOC family protein [Streptosporangiales bacterium]
MIPVRRLNHAVLFVSDLERAVAFYTEAFDMQVAAQEPAANAAFLRARRGDNHHDLGLFGRGAGAPHPPRGSTGLYHLAWQVDDIRDLAEARETLRAYGALTGESDHGATKSIYGVDPDGNEFEIMWMLPRDQWGAYEGEAPVRPLDLDAEIAKHS